MSRYLSTALTATMRQSLYGLLGSQVLLASLLYGELPLGVLASVLMANFFCVLCLIKRWPFPSTIFLIPLGIISVIGIWMWFHTLNGAQAGVSLLFLATALKTLETRTQRDLFIVAIISFLLTASTFLFGQNIARSTVALCNLIWLVAMLRRINNNDSSYKPSLIFDLRSATVQIIAAFPLMLLLFIFFPRIEGPLWGNTVGKEDGISGLSDSLSPGSLSRLVRSHALAFRAHIKGSPPPPRDRYWRAYVLNRFNGVTWLPPLKPGRPASQLERSGPLLRYTLLIQATGQKGLPSLGLPANVPTGTHLVSGYTLRTYQVINHLRAFNLQAAIAPSGLGGSAAKKVLHQDLSLPHNYAPKAQKLVHLWLDHAHGPRQVIADALDYFHSKPFYYTLTPPRLRGDITDQFLFKSRQGFCEDYASAFAILMRLAGIPSRIVVGYMGGTWNRALHYFTVDQSDAHAWVEVWLAGKGWVRVDPTSAVATSRVESGLENAAYGGIGVEVPLHNWISAMANDIRMDWGTVGYLWDTWVIAFGPTAQRDLLLHLGLRNDGFFLVIDLTIVFSVFVAIGMVLTYWQQRPLPLPPEQKLYRKYLYHLKRHGLSPKSTEGAIELAKRVGQLWPQFSQEAFLVAQQYYEVRYAPRMDDVSIERLENLRQTIRKIKLPGKVTRK